MITPLLLFSFLLGLLGSSSALFGMKTSSKPTTGGAGSLKPMGDIVFAINTAAPRVALVEKTRPLRRGLRTFVVTDKPAPGADIYLQKSHRETWLNFADVEGDPQPGTLRVAATPILTYKALKRKDEHWKWMLWGEDDMVFMLENAVRYLEHLDPNEPYYLSDNRERPNGLPPWDMYAPTCLPVNYDGPMIWGEQPVPVSKKLPPGLAMGYDLLRPPIQRKGVGCRLDDVCASMNGTALAEFKLEQTPQGCRYRTHRGPSIHGGGGAMISVGFFRMIEQMGQAKVSSVASFISDQRALGNNEIGDAMWTDFVHSLGYEVTNTGSFYTPYLNIDPAELDFASLVNLPLSAPLHSRLQVRSLISFHVGARNPKGGSHETHGDWMVRAATGLANSSHVALGSTPDPWSAAVKKLPAPEYLLA